MSAPGLTLYDYVGLYLFFTLKAPMLCGEDWFTITWTRPTSFNIDFGNQKVTRVRGVMTALHHRCSTNAQLVQGLDDYEDVRALWFKVGRYADICSGVSNQLGSFCKYQTNQNIMHPVRSTSGQYIQLKCQS